MNQQLTELAIQAQVEHCISHVRLEEFADLIVAKCIQAVKNTDIRSIVYTTYDQQLAQGTLQRAEQAIKNQFKNHD